MPFFCVPFGPTSTLTPLHAAAPCTRAHVAVIRFRRCVVVHNSMEVLWEPRNASRARGGGGREIPAQVLRNGAQPNMREPPYFHSPPSSRVRKSCGGPGLHILIHVSQGLAGWFHVEMATSGTSFWRACAEGGLFFRGLAVNPSTLLRGRAICCGKALGHIRGGISPRPPRITPISW